MSRPFITREVMNESGHKFEVCLRSNEVFPPVIPFVTTATEIKADMLTRRLNDLCEDFGTLSEKYNHAP